MAGLLHTMRIVVLYDPSNRELPAPPARGAIRIVGWLRQDSNCWSQLSRLSPKVVILDLRSSGRPRAVISSTVCAAPNARLLVIADGHRQEIAEALMECGSQGSVITDASRVDLVRALHRIAPYEDFANDPEADEFDMPAPAQSQRR